ncbi:hypothetical protein AB4254_09110 [Vibrio breoganii]
MPSKSIQSSIALQPKEYNFSILGALESSCINQKVKVFLVSGVGLEGDLLLMSNDVLVIKKDKDADVQFIQARSATSMSPMNTTPAILSAVKSAFAELSADPAFKSDMTIIQKHALNIQSRGNPISFYLMSGNKIEGDVVALDDFGIAVTSSVGLVFFFWQYISSVVEVKVDQKPKLKVY